MKVLFAIVSCFFLTACGNTVEPVVEFEEPVVELEGLQRIEIVDAVTHGAVCNDGSPAAYYFQPGQGNGLNDWVINFAGGGRCSTVIECDEKQVELKSPLLWETMLLGEGVLSDIYTENPYFYENNHVYLRQCSLDGWIGTAGRNTSNFKGSIIFKRVINDLKRYRGLTEAQNVLLTGASSGTQGVLQHLDWLASELPQTKVKGVMDAGYFLDIESYDVSLDPVMVTMAKYAEFHRSIFDDDCHLAYVNNPSFCMLPEIVLPYISAPLMVKQSQRDGVVLKLYGVIRPYDDQELFYIENYVTSLKSNLSVQSFVYSNASPGHGTVARTQFSQEKIGQIYLYDFLGEWFYQDSTQGSIIE